MKAYGMSLKDHKNCEKGCCAGSYVKLSGEGSKGVKSRRKTARQESLKEMKRCMN